MEIYNEQLYDLLATMPLSTMPNNTNPGSANDFNSANLSIYDDRGDVYVKGLTYQLVSSEEDALNLLFEVHRNAASSIIFRIAVK